MKFSFAVVIIRVDVIVPDGLVVCNYKVSHWYEMFCHDQEVVGLNPCLGRTWELSPIVSFRDVS